ncbi:MAG TPA: hypothetical protein VFH51_11030, partial [Myxococcota bacterium]|nr:hypothetical protein [Myxococcota bacterium]
GVGDERLEAVGYGPDKPVASNKTANGREQNRRVEFVILDKKPLGEEVQQAAPPPPPPQAPAAEPQFDMGPMGAPPPAGDTPPPAEAPPAAPDSAGDLFNMGPGGDAATEDTGGKKPGKKGKAKGKKKKGDEINFGF